MQLRRLRHDRLDRRRRRTRSRRRDRARHRAHGAQPGDRPRGRARRGQRRHRGRPEAEPPTATPEYGERVDDAPTDDGARRPRSRTDVELRHRLEARPVPIARAGSARKQTTWLHHPSGHPPTPVRRPGDPLTWLGVIIVGLFAHQRARRASGAAVPGPRSSRSTSGRHADHPRGADRGRQSRPTEEQLDQAVTIIRQRVDASGVGEAEITTAGRPEHRRPDPGHSRRGDARPHRGVGAARAARRARAAAARDDLRRRATARRRRTRRPTRRWRPTPTAEPTNGSDPAWITPALQAEFDAFDCAEPRRRPGERRAGRRAARSPATPTARPSTSSARSRSTARTSIDATQRHGHAADRRHTGQWAVNLQFDDAGHRGLRRGQPAPVRPAGQRRRNQFAFVLDGTCSPRPPMNGDHHSTATRRSPATSPRSRRRSLADQLKFGALPLSFTVAELRHDLGDARHRSSCRSASSPASSASSLVVIYSLFQYRALGFVTIASLVVDRRAHLPHDHASWRGAWASACRSPASRA